MRTVSIIKSFASKARCMADHLIDCYRGHPDRKQAEWNALRTTWSADTNGSDATYTWTWGDGY